MAKHSHHESHWVSLSDMMTSLMMVFLFVAVLFMYMTQKALADYQTNKQDIYQDLTAEFAGKTQVWDMEIDPDLTIKFTNPNFLFDYKSSVIKPEFEEILRQFVPQYLAIITQNKYKDTISEVRIEGHTAEDTDYLYTINLSQQRADAVLSFILSDPSYLSLTAQKQKQVQFWMTANGLGLGRAIDADGGYVYQSGRQISPKSRRVEFKIVTNSDEVILNTLNNINSK